MNTLHRNQHYDSFGKLRPSIIIDRRQKALDIVRKLVTQIDMELMEPKPQGKLLVSYSEQIIATLKEEF